MAIYLQQRTASAQPALAGAARLAEAGFVRLRSEPEPDGAVWEVWALFHHQRARGPIAGLTEAQILRWVKRVIRPGEIDHVTEHWGLGFIPRPLPE